MAVDVKELKQRAGIEPYERRLPGLRRSGKAYVAPCPWHDDRNPSFGVFEKDGEWFYKCHPCDKGGDLLDFIREFDKLAFKDALALLAHECGIGLPVKPQPFIRFEYNREAAIETLKNDDAAAEYLKSRGISRPDAVVAGVGVVDHPGIGPALAIPYDKGLIPVVKFRALNPKSKGDKFRHLTGHESSDLLYGIEYITEDSLTVSPEVFVVESELDCLTLRIHGFNAVSVSSATTYLKGGKLQIKPEHIDVLRKAERIYIAVDMDAAGEACAAAFDEVLPRHKVFRIRWEFRGKDSGDPKDIGELYSQSPDRFRERIQQLKAETSIPLLWRKAASFASLPEKNYEWIVPDFIPAGDATVFTGDFGSFKSYLSYFLADAVAGGNRFVERQCAPHPVLILDRENSHATVYLRRTLVGDLKHRDNVRILGRFTDPIAPALTEPQLLEVCARIKPLLIIDSFQDFHPGLKENDADDMVQAFGNINRLIDAGAVAAIVLHHVPKAGSGKGKLYRGSTSIPGAGGGALFVEKEGKYGVNLSGFKTRSGEDQEVKLRMVFGVREVSYEVIESGREPDAELRDRICDFVRLHDGCSMKTLADALGGRKQTVVDTVDAMALTGRLRRTSEANGLATQLSLATGPRAA